VELYLHSPKTPSWRGCRLKRSTRAILPFFLHRLEVKYHLRNLGLHVEDNIKRTKNRI